MLSSPTHLTTRRPSPTTVSFTASNAGLRASLSARVIFYLTILLRVLLGLSILLIIACKVSDSPKFHDIGAHEATFLGGSIARCAGFIAERIKWRILVPTALAIIYIVFRRGYTEESLLVLRGLGIQTSTSSPTYLSTSTTRFIPTDQIQDIFIHEAFKGFEVRFYLAVIVQGEGEVVVVFPQLLPKRTIVEEVWRGARACLYEPKS